MSSSSGQWSMAWRHEARQREERRRCGMCGKVLRPYDSIREALAICHLKQVIPIAWDMDNGVYVVTPAGEVMLVSPNVHGRQVLVAANMREFERFEPRGMPLGDSE